ncbi:hypothetical protein GCM10027599_26610 [Yimella radicis]
MNTVQVTRWNERHAVAVVDGVTVQVGRNTNGVRWSCEIHGRHRTPAGCEHLADLAATVPPPEKYQPRRSATDA